jgi:hypothetical protein
MAPAEEVEDVEGDRPVKGGNEDLSRLLGHHLVGHLEIRTADRIEYDIDAAAVRPIEDDLCDILGAAVEEFS